MSEREFEDFMTVRDVSQLLEVSERSVREFINTGELRASKVGQWRVPRSAVRDFLDRRSNWFRDRIEEEIRRFLVDRSQPENGVRNMLIRDYACNKPVNLRHVEEEINAVHPDAQSFRWRYTYDEEAGIARHVLYGEMDLVLKIVEALDKAYRR